MHQLRRFLGIAIVFIEMFYLELPTFCFPLLRNWLSLQCELQILTKQRKPRIVIGLPCSNSLVVAFTQPSFTLCACLCECVIVCVFAGISLRNGQGCAVSHTGVLRGNAMCNVFTCTWHGDIMLIPTSTNPVMFSCSWKRTQQF